MLSDINKVMINELSNKNFKKLKLKNLFLALIIIIKLIKGSNDDIYKFKLKKKLINSAKKETKMIPNIISFEKK